jgi:hypothetical protein
MRKVFVSYSRTNLDVVSQLVEDLQAVGMTTWHDQTLTGGQRWWDNILSNIRDCEIFIFALSPESWESEACRSELNYVCGLGKPILPVLVADGINLNLLSAPLHEIQVTDYRSRDKGAAFALLKALNATCACPPLPDPLPPPPAVPVSYLGTLKERIDFNGALGAQEQNLLFLEVEEAMDDGRSPAEVRELLLCLKRRDDLLAKVAVRVDAALRSLDEKTAMQQRKKGRPESTGRMFQPERVSVRSATFRWRPSIVSAKSVVRRSSNRSRSRRASMSFPVQPMATMSKKFLDRQAGVTRALRRMLFGSFRR